jgi:hypothetical protein
MKKDSGVFRISENQELAVRALCDKHSIKRSELFRRVILWAIESNLQIPSQTGKFRFSTVNKKGEAQKSSYFFGSKLSPDILVKINNLCNLNGVQESHLYRCFLDAYMMAHAYKLKPSSVKDRSNPKPVATQKYTIPSVLFSKPSFTYKFPKPDTSTLLGRIQASNMEAIEMGQNLSIAVGLAVVLFSTFSRK